MVYQNRLSNGKRFFVVLSDQADGNNAVAEAVETVYCFGGGIDTSNIPSRLQRKVNNNRQKSVIN